ncbi:MAG TPA: PEGA domain-containing protein [Candidatus Polarisedimenticolaceae bacterium]
MKNSIPRRLALLLLGTGLALAPFAAEAAGRVATRGGGHGGGGGARVSGARTTAAAPRASGQATRATAPRGGRQTASGTATYGYHYGHGHGGYYYPGYYPGYGWWGYPYYYDDFWWGYGPSWSVGFSVGWPYWGYGGYWGAPYYAYPYVEAPPAEGVGPAGIEIDVTPRNARVILNGEDVGRVKDYDGRWDHLRVGGGRQVLEIRADGFKTLRVVVDARPGSAYRLDYTLEKGEGIDPRSQDPATMPPAQAQTAAPAELVAPSARLEKGFLRLAVTPADAAIYLDGEYFARGDEVARLRGAIPLAIGEHRIEVVRPGFASRAVVVQVDRGATATASVELSPGQ